MSIVRRWDKVRVVLLVPDCLLVCWLDVWMDEKSTAPKVPGLVFKGSKIEKKKKTLSTRTRPSARSLP